MAVSVWDDSIAQITGTHVIVWGISQVAMKFVEDQRVGPGAYREVYALCQFQHESWRTIFVFHSYAGPSEAGVT
jgi:hypothetical protein